MPEMEMHGMHSQPGMDGIGFTNTQATGNIAIDSGERMSIDATPMSNCEQVCGYCLGSSQPGAKIINSVHDNGATLQADIYSRFVPSDPLKSLFRPPISA